MIAELTFTGTVEELAERLASLEASGATEVVLQPGGRDVARELNAFAAMARLAV